MSKIPLLMMLFLLLGVMLGAEEITLRQATAVRWEGLHVRSADNCEIVFWSDAALGDMDVFAQKINPSGQTLWTEPLPMVVKPGDQEILDVVMTSDNNFIIIWQEYEIYDVLGVWAQKITSNGQRLWTEDGVEISDGGQVMREATLVANSVGGAFIAFQYGYSSNSIMGQNLDALGNQLWQAGGIQLVSYSTNVNLAQAISDGAGGMIINYSSYENSQEMNHLLRLSESGSVVGNNPLMPLGSFPGYRYKIMPGNAGQYILYNISYEWSPYVRLGKIDNTGSLLLPQTVDYPLSTYEVVQKAVLAESPNGGLAVAWKCDLASGASQWRVQRLSATFAPLWPEPGVDFGQTSFVGDKISLEVGTNDNIWLTWDNSDYDGQVQEVRAQMVNAAGVPAWTEEGLTLSADNGNPLVIAYPDRAMFVWNPDLEGRTSVRRQVISSGGALFLAENGEPMVQRINGQAYLGDVIAFNNKYLTFWSDNREADKIYYQLSNANMEPLLEEGGRALSPAGLGWVGIVSVTQVSEGSVAVLYYVYDNIVFTYLLQIIDGNGNQLYPGNGLVFASNENYSPDIAMSTLGGDIYIAWKDTQNFSTYQIKGQRISNGQLMWGETGRDIITFGENIYPSVKAMQGRYIMWVAENYSTNETYCQALLVSEYGYPATGWEASGLSLIEADDYFYQSIQQSGIVDGDLVAFAYYNEDGYGIVRAQRLSSEGERMWGENGVEPGLPGQINWIYDAVYDDGITCLMQAQGDNSNIRVQKLSYTGQRVWGDEGNLVADDLNNCYDAQLGKFANGSYFAVYSDNDGAWIQNRDVFIRYITPQGVPQGEAPSVLCSARYQQDHVQAAVIGNQAFITWSDDRAGIINSEVAMTGVWGNRIVSDYVAADDPLETPPAMLSIAGNYPNPFNPSTTISFELGKAGSTEVCIYNLKGQLVRTLLYATDLLAGKHNLIWNGCDDKGRCVSSGIYLCNVTSSGNNASRKMVLAK